jgi:hypothetical protein
LTHAAGKAARISRAANRKCHDEKRLLNIGREEFGQRFLV